MYRDNIYIYKYIYIYNIHIYISIIIYIIYFCGLTEARSPQNLKVQDPRNAISTQSTGFFVLDKSKSVPLYCELVGCNPSNITHIITTASDV